MKHRTMRPCAAQSHARAQRRRAVHCALHGPAPTPPPPLLARLQGLQWHGHALLAVGHPVKVRVLLPPQAHVRHDEIQRASGGHSCTRRRGVVEEVLAHSPHPVLQGLGAVGGECWQRVDDGGDLSLWDPEAEIRIIQEMLWRWMPVDGKGSRGGQDGVASDGRGEHGWGCHGTECDGNGQIECDGMGWDAQKRPCTSHTTRNARNIGLSQLALVYHISLWDVGEGANTERFQGSVPLYLICAHLVSLK